MKHILAVIIILTSIASCKKEKETSATISGQWRCTETNNNAKTYIIDLEKSASTSLYAIYNFNNSGYEQMVFASYQNDSLNIELQFIGTSSISVEGGAKIKADKTQMQIEYLVTDASGIKEVSCNCEHL